jgi:hypothetical protein
VTLYTRGFSRFVTSTTAPIATGWSWLPGGTCTHWKRRRSTAHARSGRWRYSRSNALIQEFHEGSYSTELLNALINLAIKAAIAWEESSCIKCFP